MILKLTEHSQSIKKVQHQQASLVAITTPIDGKVVYRHLDLVAKKRKKH